MATTSASTPAQGQPAAATTIEAPRGRIWRFGSGLALAMTCVGAGDMVTALNGAEGFGMGLAWAVAVGVIVKYALTEAVGRLQLGTGHSFMGNMGKAGRWLPLLFLLAVSMVALLYGAALGSVAALAVTTAVPALPLMPTTIAVITVGGAMVLMNRYRGFERVMVGVSALLVLGTVVLAALTLGYMESPDRVVSTATVSIPEGSLFALLALIGGVGGSVGIAIYGYWIQEKNWSGVTYLRTVRRDLGLSYLVTFLFFALMSVVGTGLLFNTGRSLSESSDLAALADPISQMGGDVSRLLFLAVFFLVVFSSIIGGFNGIGYLVADAVRVLRRVPESEASKHVSTTSPVFRGTCVALVVVGLCVSFAGEPVVLVLAYAAVGALFLPMLTASLLWLLNRRDVEPGLRNRPLANIVMAAALVLFAVLAVVQLSEMMA